MANTVKEAFEGFSSEGVNLDSQRAINRPELVVIGYWSLTVLLIL